MGLLDNKVILITGSTHGIGKAAAIEAAKEGAKVVVSGRNIQNGNQVVEDIKALGREAIFIPADVNKEEDIKNLIQKTIAHFGRLDGAFNNAGIPGEMKKITSISTENFENVVKTNLTGVFLCTKYEILAMQKQNPKGGSIVQCSSIASEIGCQGYSCYGATKAAINQMTRCAAMEVAKDNIRINTVLLGYIDETGITGASTYINSALKEMTQVRTILGRMGTVDEAVKPVMFLLSNNASYMTGAEIPVDGGLSAI